MLKKSDNEKHFSWCFILKLSLLFFLVTLIPYVSFFSFLSSHGFSSLLITITVMFVSTFVFFVRFFKRKTRRCLAERFKEEGDEDNDDDEDDDDEESDDEDEDGLIEIALVSEEETVEAMRKNNKSRQRIRIDEYQEEEIDDVNMEEDNFIEIDISIGSIKRRI